MATNEGVIDVDDQNDEVEVPGEENKPKLKSVVWQHFPYKKGAKLTRSEFDCCDLIHGTGSEKSKEIVGKVTKTLDELFNHYKGKAENKNVPNSQDPIFGEKSSISDIDIDLELEFDKFDDGGQDIKTEVDIYLADRKEKRDPKFDILGWWKANSIKFPILSKLARHVLAMPISTVASESTFSTGGRVIDKYRSSLNTETAEALICAQDWIRRTRVDL